jgi:hypothetical protein
MPIKTHIRIGTILFCLMWAVRYVTHVLEELAGKLSPTRLDVISGEFRWDQMR